MPDDTFFRKYVRKTKNSIGLAEVVYLSKNGPTYNKNTIQHLLFVYYLFIK